jgi:hypothetical protein
MVRLMKVSGASGPGGVGAAGRGKGVGGGAGFSLGGTAPAAGASGAAPVGGVQGVASIGALLALQEMGTPTERRRRAVGRAGRILDVLDEVKIAVLDGEVRGIDLERLRRAVRDARDGTDDAGLEVVLDEIETRAAVELAKLEVSRARANHAA